MIIPRSKQEAMVISRADEYEAQGQKVDQTAIARAVGLTEPDVFRILHKHQEQKAKQYGLS